MTDEYVEGTVPVSSFMQLRRGLGSRKVAYMLVGETESDRDIHWGNAIEEVGLGERAGSGSMGTGDRIVRDRC